MQQYVSSQFVFYKTLLDNVLYKSSTFSFVSPLFIILICHELNVNCITDFFKYFLYPVGKHFHNFSIHHYQQYSTTTGIVPSSKTLQMMEGMAQSILPSLHLCINRGYLRNFDTAAVDLFILDILCYIQQDLQKNISQKPTYIFICLSHTASLYLINKCNGVAPLCVQEGNYLNLIILFICGCKQYYYLIMSILRCNKKNTALCNSFASSPI